MVGIKSLSYSRALGAVAAANDAMVLAQGSLTSTTSARVRRRLSKDRKATLWLSQTGRTWAKLDEEIWTYEDKAAGTRRALDSMRTTESK